MRMMSGLILAACLSAALPLAAADENLGAPLTLKTQTPIAELLAKPARFVGRSVQVKGKITDVCQKMGCWIMLLDAATGASIRIKANDGEIVFPKESIGKMAVAEGSFQEIKLTRAQAVERAKHEAEEKGAKFDPASVRGPLTIYQIQGTGAIIVD
ncbi:MAG: DUF4920 domain-containing protein [Bryobacteraceae bacterium]|jgi:hypothetical protein